MVDLVVTLLPSEDKLMKQSNTVTLVSQQSISKAWSICIISSVVAVMLGHLPFVLTRTIPDAFKHPETFLFGGLIVGSLTYAFCRAKKPWLWLAGVAGSLQAVYLFLFSRIGVGDNMPLLVMVTSMVWIVFPVAMVLSNEVARKLLQREANS